MSQQCPPPAVRLNTILSCMTRSKGRTLRMWLLPSAQHSLDHIQHLVLEPQQETQINALGWVQQGAPRDAQGWSAQGPELVQPRHEKALGGLKLSKGKVITKMEPGFAQRWVVGWLQAMGVSWNRRGSGWVWAKNLFPVRAIKKQQNLPREVLQSLSLGALRTRLDKALNNLTWPHS